MYKEELEKEHEFIDQIYYLFIDGHQSCKGKFLKTKVKMWTGYPVLWKNDADFRIGIFQGINQRLAEDQRGIICDAEP